MSTDPCVVCRRREPTTGYVCDECQNRITDQLCDLLQRLSLLPLHLTPGQAPPGPRVSTSRTGSPTPARLDVLSLLGPGSPGRPGAAHPLVRRWSTTRQVEVETRVGTYHIEKHTEDVTEWHQELIRDPQTGRPVMVCDDDQTGLIPPREWLGQQVDAWREALGHHTRRPPARTSTQPEPEPPLVTDEALAWLTRHAPPGVVVGAWQSRVLLAAYRQGRADLITGMSAGYAGRRPTDLREDDPLADEWEIRFGEPHTARAPTDNVRYLTEWLPAAAGRDDLDLAAFAAELRSLHAEITRVLGDRPDEQWLGRCPSSITDRISGERRPCGAGLWQDPHASVVACPRCRSSWGPRVVHLIHLAREIRRVWPLDRRRRYQTEEASERNGAVRCPACAGRVHIVWQDVTGTEDKERWWQPTKVRCYADHDEAGGLL